MKNLFKLGKIRLSFLAILGVAVVALVAWLVFGLAAPMVTNLNAQKHIKTTHGLAVNESETDPHVTKTSEEYDNLIFLSKDYNVTGIYEKQSAGDYSYEKLEPEHPGRYTIETTLFFETPENATEAYASLVDRLTGIGYTPADKEEPNEKFTSLERMFIAADESSNGSPGSDKFTLTNISNDVGKIVLLFQTPEIPLKGIPSNGEKDVTVSEYNKTIENIISGEINLCEYEPNGLTGGWYPDYECLQDKL